MADKDLKNSYKGIRFKVTHCDGAIKSLSVALNHVDKAKTKSLIRGLILQIEKLSDGGRMSKENFPQEGALPKLPGKDRAKKFNALKRLPIRGYCWLSERHPNTYFISHYVYKDYKKLKPKDVSLVADNWNRIEVGGDEC